MMMDGLLLQSLLKRTYLRHEPRLEGAEAAVARPGVVIQLDAVEA